MLEFDMTAHKHAALFRAVADGDVDEWQCLNTAWPTTDWDRAVRHLDEIAESPEDWDVRRKQPATKTVTFGGWKPATKTVTFGCYMHSTGSLHWTSDENTMKEWTRIPSLDKTAEVPV